jgi:hypothetical protein
MKLTDLEPSFLKITGEHSHKRIDTIQGADGIVFLCPKCFSDNAGTDKGVHSIICWQPHVPLTSTKSGPGRWNFQGTSYADLSLVNGSSSIALNGGCQAHFFIKNGNIE